MTVARAPCLAGMLDRDSPNPNVEECPERAAERLNGIVHAGSERAKVVKSFSLGFEDQDHVQGGDTI